MIKSLIPPQVLEEQAVISLLVKARFVDCLFNFITVWAS